MKSPLTAAERQRIDAAIATVEQSTRADLDVMVTRASDRYALYPLLWAGAGALLLAGLAALLRADLSGRVIVLVELASVIVLTALCDWMPLRLRLVPARVKHAHARHLARREFNRHFANVNAPREHILFFVSLGERYVEIIADRETDARVPLEVWHQVVGDFTATVAAGRVADGLVAAIEACGTILRTHYPRRD
jgi:putative membrane protein